MWPLQVKMAEEQNMATGAHEKAHASSNLPSLLANEASDMKQEVSSPIPGFPPLFQFAKLQTEATSWTSNAAESSSSCDEFSDKQLVTPIKSQLSNERSPSLQGANATLSSSENEIECLNTAEKSGLGVVMNLHEGHEEEDNEEIDRDDDKGDEPDEEEAESDPYFYTKRDEFTSEIYKIELQNLPKKCGYKVRTY